MNNISIPNLKKIIEQSNQILILTHKSPDGDAIGSALALYHSIKQLNKNVDVIAVNYSQIFKVLEASNNIIETSTKNYDTVITLDCSCLNRIEQDKPYFQNATQTINIDHHITNEYFATYNYIEMNSPATTQILYKLLKKWNIEITQEIGECLITGLITDTGGFKHSNVNKETFQMAAELLDKNVNISKFYNLTLDTKTKPQFELTKLATSRLEFYMNNKVALTYITLEDEKKFNAKTGDHEGIVDIGRNIEQVQISIFLHQSHEGYKVSFRSNNDLDVSKIALTFGGGGHKSASGCLIADPLEITKIKILKEIENNYGWNLNC